MTFVSGYPPRSGFRRTLATAATAAILAAPAPTSAAQPGADNVLYLLTSDAPITAIDWIDSQGNTRRDTSATSHAWYWSFTNTDRPPRYHVAGRTSGSYIRCQILINTRVVADNTGPQAATCAL